MYFSEFSDHITVILLLYMIIINININPSGKIMYRFSTLRVIDPGGGAW